MKSIEVIFIFIFIFYFITGCKHQKNDFTQLEMEWHLVKNEVRDDHPIGIAKMIFKNKGKSPIKYGDWFIDFNQITNFEKSNGDTMIGQIDHINGYLYRFSPGKNFAINGGDSLVYEYISTDPIIKAGYTPRGAYVVDKDKITPLPTIKVKGFDILENVFPDSTILATVPTAENTFELNQRIQSLKGEGWRSKIIPMPAFSKTLSESFILSNDVVIIADSSTKSEAKFLGEFLQKNFGLILRRNGNKTGKVISLSTDKNLNHHEEYELKILENKIEIIGGSAAGVFYGIQSLIQLIPEGHFKEKGKDIVLEGIQVKDKPRFEYRGFLLDISRNFLPKNRLLKIIDLLSLYKINKLNLRLTEDEGWRIEIKELPELTEIGSKRGHSFENNMYLQPAFGSGPYPSNNREYYTVQDYKDIVKYAAERHIEIIPEICFPSHARAAIVSMEVRHQRLTKQGKHKEAEEFRLIDPADKSVYRSAQGFKDNIVNVARPSIYHFYETIVKSLIQMHNEVGVPLKTFNTGGDEVPYGAWSASPMAKDLLRTLPSGTSSVQLQGYFLEKTLAMLSKYHLKVTGWEEIVLKKNQGQKPEVNTNFLGKNVIPLVWDNTGDNIDLGYRIANAGYPVVLCNVTSLYADLAYDNDPLEPGLYWGGFTTNFDPFYTAPFDVFKTGNYTFWGQMTKESPNYDNKEKLNKNLQKNILGISMQLWSETLTEGPDMFEYFTLPKLFAFAEKAWSKSASWENENNVNKRIEKAYSEWASLTNIIGLYHLPRLELWNGGYHYRVSPPGVKIVDQKYQINNEFPNFITRYTTDGSDPDTNSPELTAQTPVQENMKVRAFSSSGKMSKVFSLYSAQTITKN